MGICKYCGKPAGFLKSKHKECELKYNNGKSKIKLNIKEALNNKINLADLLEEIDNIAKESFIKADETRKLIFRGWKEAVEAAFEDGILTEDEEKRLNEMIEVFNFNRDKLNSDSSYQKIVKGAILRDIMDGKLPDRVKIKGNIPFNLQKNEKIVWLFNDVDYYEKRTRREYVGGYQGFSVRIAKGVYYRVGGFKGRPVTNTETVYIDSGIMAITNKHIYFSGGLKSFRIKYEKIVSFEPYSDGLGVQRDAQTAKPQIFVTGDGWFTFNLVKNLAELRKKE